MNFKIGYNSEGKLIAKELLEHTHLFVSYISYEQVKDIFSRFIEENNRTITRYLLIGKEQIIGILPASKVLNKYVMDNPEGGNIKTIRRLFTATHQILIKRKAQKKAVNEPILVFIDDIWQLVPRLNKLNSSKLKDLLMEGSTFGIYFMIGSTLPYRNLLVQLMQQARPNRSVVNETGAEMIINPDGLIFFRENGQLDFTTYFPGP